MAEETTNQGLGLGFSVDVDTKGHDKGVTKIEKRNEKLGEALDKQFRDNAKREANRRKEIEKSSKEMGQAHNDAINRYRKEFNEIKKLEQYRQFAEESKQKSMKKVTKVRLGYEGGKNRKDMNVMDSHRKQKSIEKIKNGATPRTLESVKKDPGVRNGSTSIKEGSPLTSAGNPELLKAMKLGEQSLTRYSKNFEQLSTIHAKKFKKDLNDMSSILSGMTDKKILDLGLDNETDYINYMKKQKANESLSTKFQSEGYDRSAYNTNEEFVKAIKNIKKYKREADKLRASGLSDAGYFDDQEFVRYEGGRAQNERKRAIKSNKPTTSQISIDNMDAPVYTFSRELLQLTDSLEKAGKRMSAMNIAMQKLGSNASMKKLKEMEKHISKGIGRARITALAGLAIGGGAGYAGFQGAKGDKVSDVRENEYYPKVNETMDGLTSNLGKFELMENELLKGRKDIILAGKSIYASAEDELAQARIDNIKSWKGAFEEAVVDQFSMDSLQKNLDDQLRVIGDFSKNMQKLIKAGASGEMIEELFSKGATSENAGQVQALANASTGQQQQAFKTYDQIQATEVNTEASVGVYIDKSNEIKMGNDFEKLMESFEKERQKLLDRDGITLEMKEHIMTMTVTDTSKIKAFNAMDDGEFQKRMDNGTAIRDISNRTATSDLSLLPEFNDENSNRIDAEVKRMVGAMKYLEDNLSKEAFDNIKVMDTSIIQTLSMSTPEQLAEFDKSILDTEESAKDLADLILGDKNGTLRREPQKKSPTITPLGDSLDDAKESGKDASSGYVDSFGKGLAFILDGFSSMMKWIDKIDENTDGAFSKFIGWGALIGGLLMTVLAPLAVGIGSVGFAATFGAIATALAPLLAGLAAVLGVVIPVTIAIVGGALALGAMWKNSKKMRTSFGKMWDGFKDALKPIGETFGIIWKSVEKLIFEVAKLFLGGKIESWGDLWKRMGDEYAKIFDRIIEYLPTLKKYFENVKNLVMKFLGGFGKGFGSIIQGEDGEEKDSPIVKWFNIIMSIFQGIGDLANWLAPILMPVFEVLGWIAGVAFGGLILYIESMVNVFGLLLDVITKVGKWLADDIKGDWNTLMEWWDTTGKSLMAPFEEFGKGAMKIIEEIKSALGFETEIGKVDSEGYETVLHKSGKPSFLKTAIMSNPVTAVLGAAFYANGTDGHPGGLAVFGEEGEELWQTKDGRMGLSPDKATLTNMPKGTKVMPHAQTEQFMNDFNRNTVPAYAKGIGQIDLGNQRQEMPIVKVYIGNEEFNGHIVRVNEKSVKRKETTTRRNKGDLAY